MQDGDNMSNLNFIGNVTGMVLAFALATDGRAAGEQATGRVSNFSSPTSSAAPRGGNHPDFSGMWTRGATVTTPFRPPPSGPGPVLSVAAAGTKTNDPGAVYRQGDYTAPVLQPWAAEVVRAHADSERAGKPVRSAKETCWPMGVPYILELNLRAQIIDDDTQIVFLYEQLMQQRFVRLNAAHPINLKPSWYGDSVGHWEGDTLVVDTVGLDKRTWVDGFGTPHTEKLHVVERYHLRNPDTLEVLLTVDDPGAFTTPWSAIASYRKDRSTSEPYIEVACAENNRDEATGGLYPMPVAKTPDF
jgi:hypothetical protein